MAINDEIEPDTGQGTGTTIAIKLNPDVQASHWDLEDFADSFIRNNRLTGMEVEWVIEGRNRNEIVAKKDALKPAVKHVFLESIDRPDYKIDIYTAGEYEARRYKFIDVLNRGLPQFQYEVNVGRDDVPLPTVIIADVHSKVGAAEKGYPFQADRQHMSEEAELDVKEYVAGKMNIPLVTVGVGLTKPDDAMLRSLVVPDVVFANDLVTARIQCRANGYEGRVAPIVIRLDGIEVARKTITFTGQTQFEEVPFKAGRNRGAALLEVELTPLPGEATLENNTLRQSLRVLDDKIKVLYIEGSPRWEFRYLRGVLKRDPRIDVQFVTTEGDKELARASNEHLARFPDRAEEALKYDLIILGDVRANTFTPTQFGFIEQLVRERGGSLIMLAGQKHTPGDYLDTPLAAMLPVQQAPRAGAACC